MITLIDVPTRFVVMGLGTNDRPPVWGIVGRESGHIHHEVISNSTRDILEFNVLDSTVLEATVNTDEWEAYSHLSEINRVHITVCYKPGRCEWARDDDGYGIREVHNNTMKWTGLRNFLCTFQGIHKNYLKHYVGILSSIII